MSFTTPLALENFIKKNPPAKDNICASKELISSYKDILPACLLELWEKTGFGLYGEKQITIIRPYEWQPVLDRWLENPSTGIIRTPIALTAFGILLYYRKITAEDEDVARVDPFSRVMTVLNWSLEDFFNKDLCTAHLPEGIAPPVDENAGLKSCGPLNNGEVYKINRIFFSMHMLFIKKVNALEMHRRLRAAYD